MYAIVNMSYSIDVLKFMLVFLGTAFVSSNPHDSEVLFMVKRIQEQAHEHESVIKSLQNHITKQDDVIGRLFEKEKQQSQRIAKQDDLLDRMLEQGKQQSERIANQDNLLDRLLAHGKQQSERIANQDDLLDKLLEQGNQQSERIANQDDLLDILIEQEKQQSERITNQDDLLDRLIEQEKQQSERITNQDDKTILLMKQIQRQNESITRNNNLQNTLIGRQNVNDAHALSGLRNGIFTNHSRESHSAVTLPNKSAQKKFKKGVLESSSLVAFQAKVSANDVPHIGLNQKIIFDDVSMNLGDAYHSQHGLFIAPSPGLYIFSTSALSFDASRNIECGIMKNGVFLGGAISNSFQDHGQGSVTVATQLNTGDEVWVQMFGQQIPPYTEAILLSWDVLSRLCNKGDIPVVAGHNLYPKFYNIEKKSY